MSKITPGMDISQHTGLPGRIGCKQAFGVRQSQETQAMSGEESLSSLLVVGVNADYI